MLGQRADNPRAAIIRISRVGQVLELAPAALREKAARRGLVACPPLYAAIIEQNVTWNGESDMAAAFRDAVTARGDPNDLLAHRAEGMAATRSSAIMAGPAILAASP